MAHQAQLQLQLHQAQLQAQPVLLLEDVFMFHMPLAVITEEFIAMAYLVLVYRGSGMLYCKKRSLF